MRLYVATYRVVNGVATRGRFDINRMCLNY